MEPSSGKILAFLLIFWVVYFLVVFFGLTWLYFKLIGAEPQSPSAKSAWEQRARFLKRLMTGIGVGMILAPLLLPLIVRWLS